MRSSFPLLVAIFCIKVCFFVTIATQFLGGIVEKYNAELRRNLSPISVVDPSWNPNELLVKGWAPVLSSYPEIQSKRLVRQALIVTDTSETEDDMDWQLPIPQAQIDLPIKPASHR